MVYQRGIDFWYGTTELGQRLCLGIDNNRPLLYHRERKWKKTSREVIKGLLKVFYPAAVTDKNIYQALELEWDDFEDSVQFIVGMDLSVDYIVTRNIRDFFSSSIDAVTPEQFLQAITDIADNN